MVLAVCTYSILVFILDTDYNLYLPNICVPTIWPFAYVYSITILIHIHVIIHLIAHLTAVVNVSCANAIYLTMHR